MSDTRGRTIDRSAPSQTLSVVLLMKIEKRITMYSTSFFKYLMMDASRQQRRMVNCKNALFIMTSNLGSEQLLEKMQSNAKMSKEAILAILEPIIRKSLPSGIIIPLDEIHPFLPLQEKDMEKNRQHSNSSPDKTFRSTPMYVAMS